VREGTLESSVSRNGFLPASIVTHAFATEHVQSHDRPIRISPGIRVSSWLWTRSSAGA